MQTRNSFFSTLVQAATTFFPILGNVTNNQNSANSSSLAYRVPVEVYLEVLRHLDDQGFINFMLVALRSKTLSILFSADCRSWAEWMLRKRPYPEFWELKKNNELNFNYKNHGVKFFKLNQTISQAEPGYYRSSKMKIGELVIDICKAYQLIRDDKLDCLYEEVFNDEFTHIAIDSDDYWDLMAFLKNEGGDKDNDKDKWYVNFLTNYDYYRNNYVLHSANHEFEFIFHFIPQIIDVSAINCFEGFVRLFFRISQSSKNLDWHEEFIASKFDELMNLIFSSKEIYFLSRFIHLTAECGNDEFMTRLVNSWRVRDKDLFGKASAAAGDIYMENINTQYKFTKRG